MPLPGSNIRRPTSSVHPPTSRQPLWTRCALRPCYYRGKVIAFETRPHASAVTACEHYDVRSFAYVSVSTRFFFSVRFPDANNDAATRIARTVRADRTNGVGGGGEEERNINNTHRPIIALKKKTRTAVWIVVRVRVFDDNVCDVKIIRRAWKIIAHAAPVPPGRADEWMGEKGSFASSLQMINGKLQNANGPIKN